ncbi:MAG TPA: tetratricopeptide repeat protein [Verrucomicrobiae bacterium]|nr:tetratricopeptide repeat protein [Verrucomicrobiae bacterium]
MPAQNTSSALAWPVAFGLFCCGVFFPTRSPAQDLNQAQDLFVHGQYEEVIKAADARLNARYSEGWRILQIQSLLTVGRYGEAYTNAMANANYRSTSLEIPLLCREAALYQNDVPAANAALGQMKALIERRGAFYQNDQNVVSLGQALLLLGVEPKLILENCFRRAEKLDPPQRAAFLAVGNLALDKHDFALAADTFREGLKKFPGDPDMEYGLGRSFETGDRSEMLAAINAALAANPRHIPSLLLLASHLIDAEQYDDANKQLALALKVNPRRPEALALRAVLATLRNDPVQADDFRRQALSSWKTNPEVDFLLGQKLSRKYRFEEGAASQRLALGFDPEYLPARRELAEDLLRLGRSEEGWELAKAVHEADGYDVTAYNLVTLHDQMARYRTLTNDDFIVRMSTNEARLYGERVLDLLGRARKTLCAKYGVELKYPTTVEIFSQQKDFAVRTFGMPDNPGYLGVCFGSVITANSPASQAPNPANWEDVLWHEFCHVVTLTATRNRMPRWLSEGISVYEERQADPTWGESLTLAYRQMILDGESTPIGKLSGAFLTPKNHQYLQFAYFESSMVVEFLVERFGFGALKTILADLREGEAMNKALAAHTLPLPDLEKQFEAFLRDRAAKLAPGVDLDKPPADAQKAEIWLKVHPSNYHWNLQQARECMQAHRWKDAKPLLESLASAYRGERRDENPLWLLAVTQRNLDETNEEFATLEKYAAQESDFADVFLRLIELSEAGKNWPAAAKYAERLLSINPLVSAPYRALGEAGVALGRPDQAILGYRKLLLLDPPDPVQAHFELARLLHQSGGSDIEAKRHVLEALEEAPRFRDAQRLLLDLEKSATNNASLSATSKS